MPCQCRTQCVTVGTPSVTNMTYAWTPTTTAGALSCTNCAQPTSSYTNTSTPEIYTVSVSYSACTTATSTVQVTAMGCGSGCGSGCREAQQAIINASLGIPVHLAVFPNPSSQNITITLTDVADYVRIIDMQGSIVYETQNTVAGQLRLDISQYNKGIYFVMAKIGNNIEKQKLIVE